ncbi:MAG: (2Fe-2S)-binding protein [Proteobacteria bacterium]|nr:(2Fe-2S)-binding protein [Pseudomonadota bacterium]MBU1738907.1 (2Fe-2S)-binding protein [Pseudomonadota bacterium]
MIKLNINNREYQVEAAADEPLLWVIRDRLQMTGTKFGCGIGECGACTVQIDGEAVQSCQVEAGDAVGKKITTIEGLPENHPVRNAWLEKEVPQCGYCHSGQIMSAASLLAKKPKPTDSDIDEAMAINICRCGTYPRIRQAIHHAARKKA